MRLWEKNESAIYRPDFFARHSYQITSGLKFYSLLLLLFIGLRVLVALPATVQFYQTILSDAWDRQTAVVTSLFPEELVVSVKNGTVITNVTEPYAIPMPQEWSGSQHGLPTNLLVINTTKPIDTADFETAATWLILGKNSFGVHQADKGEFRIYDLGNLSQSEVLNIDKEKYAGLVAKFSDILRLTMIIGGIALPFIWYAVLWIAYLVYLVFGALVVWGGAKWRGHQITYGDAYVAGLFLLPIPLLYAFLSSYEQGLIRSVPFAFSLLLFVMTIINFEKRDPAASSPHVAAPETATGEGGDVRAQH